MVPLDAIRDPEIVASAEQAVDFIRSFGWCGKVHGGYLARWRSSTFAVFKFHIAPTRPSVKDTVWVVVNQSPRACSVCECAEDWQDALKDFIWEMQRWLKSDPGNIDTGGIESYLKNLRDDLLSTAPSDPSLGSG
jgi:hypothetical protein